MEKVLVNTGTRLRLSEIFEDIQDYAKTNLDRLTDLLFESYGVNAATNPSGEIAYFYDAVSNSYSIDKSLWVVVGDFGRGTGTDSGYTITDTLEIRAGDGLTAGFHYINVPNTVQIPFTATLSGTHNLFVKFKTYQDTLVDVIAGNNFPAGTIQTPSREHSTYEFVWDTNPGVSGMWLATVTATSRGFIVGGVTDRRQTNVLKINSKALPTTIVRRDTTDPQSMLGTLVLPELIVQSGTNQLSISPGTSGIVAFSGSDVADLKRNKHTQNTDTGTTSTTFRIGVGTLGNTGNGLVADTLPDAPPAPLNVRMTDLYPIRNPWYLRQGFATGGLLSTNTPVYPIVGAVIKWNWSDIQGTGGSGTFSITTSSGTWNADALIGYYLYLPPYSLSVVITDNAATSAGTTALTVKNTDYSVVDLTGKTLSSGNPGTIYPPCDRYEVVAVPVNESSQEMTESRIEQTITYKPDIILSTTTIELLTMRKYNIYVRAVLREQVSTYTRMGSGTYSKDPSIYSASTFSYSQPLTAQLASLKSRGVSLVGSPKPYGFVATIDDSDDNCWSPADNFEFVWTWANEGANFEDTRMERTIQKEKTLRVPTTDARTFNVKARPLMAGQSVIDTSVLGSGISLDIISGGGGQSNLDYPIYQEHVSHRTYSCVVDAVNSGVVTLSTVKSPNGTATQAIIGPELEGEVLYDGDNEYLLTSFQGSTTTTYNYGFSPLFGGGSTPIPGGAEIGVTEWGRRIRTVSLNASVKITRIYVDCDFMTGTKVRVRWYQDSAGGKILADSVLVTASDTGYPQSSDIVVDDRMGALNIAIDLYDDGTSPDNNSCFSGAITIYGQDNPEGRYSNYITPINVPIESDTTT